MAKKEFQLDKPTEFLLAHGNYTIGGKKPVSYKQGETIVSEVDLVAKHGSKFEYKNIAVVAGAAAGGASGPTMVKSADEGRFDVLDADGNVTNEKTLTKAQAATALAKLIASGFDDDDGGGSGENETGGGDWDQAATWDTGVPVNGDTFLIKSGDTVVMNDDQSGFAAR